ncbi:hypothetical protein M5689_009036 [Euphorbia peplus]|nr:hypothetical protein M5689_009036 [Euphorbia peplus]
MLYTNGSPTLKLTMSEVVIVPQGNSKTKPSFHVPYSTDDFAMIKDIPSLIASTQSHVNLTRKRTAVSYYVVSMDDDVYRTDEIVPQK